MRAPAGLAGRMIPCPGLLPEHGDRVDACFLMVELALFVQLKFYLSLTAQPRLPSALNLDCWKATRLRVAREPAPRCLADSLR